MQSNTINLLTANLCKILFVLGLPYVILKILDKRKGVEDKDSFFRSNKMVLYHLHLTGLKFAVIFSFVHGFMVARIDGVYVITGWVLGSVMVVLLGLGAFLSIKSGSEPMDWEDDRNRRRIRAVKWALTLLMFVSLALHYLLSGWVG